MEIRHLFTTFETEKLEETVEFYKTFLGFECRGAYPKENPCWVSLWNGDCEVAFGLPNAHAGFEKPQLTGSVYLTVEDVEAAWASLKDKVEIVYPIENFGYGMREFGIKDCNGYVLNIGQDIS
jgi:predicted enzyme related to lactoylglutathione lyase